VKGTAHVLETITQLQAEGVDLRFELVTGRAREDAHGAYARAAVIVDQLLAGWYGGVAVEAMALGKPVVCALQERGLRHVPEALRTQLPVVSATPGTLPDVLRALLRDAERRKQTGLAGRAFVERWHDPRSIARVVIPSYVA
jgi:glycosyltransferase involved in cell wall biosynthesis